MIVFKQLLENVRALSSDDSKPDPKWRKVKVTISVEDNGHRETRKFLTGGKSRKEVHDKINKQYAQHGIIKVIDYEFNPKELR